MTGRTLKVCHLGKYYPPARGGIETHVASLGRAQAALGATVRVLCVQHADAAGRDVSWRLLARTRSARAPDPGGDGVEVVRLGRLASLARLDVAPRLVAAVREAATWADVLHLHVPNPTFLLALAALRGRGPALVVTHHSDVVRQRLLRLAVRPFEEVVYRRAAAIVATSRAYADASPLLRAFAGRVRVIPLGIDVRAWAEAPDPLALATLQGRLAPPAEEPLWLSVGRLVYYKGLATALEALSAVPGRWAIVGEGPEGPALRARAARLGLAGRVVWLGEVDRGALRAAYHQATALWFPSDARSEAFGLVQVEAMAAGCPVLNCAVPGSGVPWVAPHDEAALTVPAGDAGAFAAAARRMANPAVRARLAEGARRRAAAFDQAALAEATLGLYREVVTP